MTHNRLHSLPAKMNYTEDKGLGIREIKTLSLSRGGSPQGAGETSPLERRGNIPKFLVPLKISHDFDEQTDEQTNTSSEQNSFSSDYTSISDNLRGAICSPGAGSADSKLNRL